MNEQQQVKLVKELTKDIYKLFSRMDDIKTFQPGVKTELTLNIICNVVGTFLAYSLKEVVGFEHAMKLISDGIKENFLRFREQINRNKNERH